MQESENKYSKLRPKKAKHKGKSQWTVYGKLCIPEEDDEVQTPLIIVAHCGTTGHLGCE